MPRLIVKEFPILGPNSVNAGKMALAALDVDRSKYKALNDALMTFQGDLSESVAYRLAGEVGYDIAALRDRAESGDIDDRERITVDVKRAPDVGFAVAGVHVPEALRKLAAAAGVTLPDGTAPSARAAEIVLQHLNAG